MKTTFVRCRPRCAWRWLEPRDREACTRNPPSDAHAAGYYFMNPSTLDVRTLRLAYAVNGYLRAYVTRYVAEADEANWVRYY